MKAFRHHLSEFSEYRRMFGLRDAIGGIAYHAVAACFPRVHRRQGIVFLHEMIGQAASVACDEMALLAQIGVDSRSVNRLKQEYEELRQILRSRASGTASPYPDHFAVEGRSACAIYVLARFLRPKTVLETGVANGHSTYFLLHALRENGEGQLHSIDVANDVGGLLTAEERKPWHLHLLDPQRPETSLQRIVESIPPVDFFLHDADHTYRGVWRELNTVWPRLTSGALLAADDCDYSWAFADFCRKHHLPFDLLFDQRKLFGLARLQSDSAADPQSK